MQTYECKMCGGNLDYKEGQTVATCEFCGLTMTVSSDNKEKIVNLFNRANYYRRKSDFENAAISYHNIIAEDEKNAEAYWGLCLCKYGIEYVEDEKTEKLLPTCHRTLFQSILQDEDYLQALELADVVARNEYKQEATIIDAIQKQILDISAKEEPYDIFICYKELDEMGERTEDSVIAQDIYAELIDQNYRVFFSRITLEDKIGSAYEPYIFAALNSARIMLVIGTRREYMEAVWVKNEWTRFLDMKRQDNKKTLIPVIKNMSPYEMPDVFSQIQSVNMEKLGAKQDLLRGIAKISQKEKEKVVEKTIISENSAIEPILARLFLFLKDCNWERADEYAERVLDMEPYNAEAYLGKMCARMKVSKREDLGLQRQPISDFAEYSKIMEYGSDSLKQELQKYAQMVNECIQQEKRQKQEELLIAIKNKKHTEMLNDFTRMKKRVEDECKELGKQNEDDDKKLQRIYLLREAKQKDIDKIKIDEGAKRKANFIIYLVPLFVFLILLCFCGFSFNEFMKTPACLIFVPFIVMQLTGVVTFFQKGESWGAELFASADSYAERTKAKKHYDEVNENYQNIKNRMSQRSQSIKENKGKLEGIIRDEKAYLAQINEENTVN